MSSKVDKILTATQSGLSPEHGDVMLQVLADRDVPDTKKEEIVKKLWTAVKSVASSNSVPASLHMISVPSEVRSNATAKLQEVQKLEHERASLTNDSRHSKLRELLEAQAQVAEALDTAGCPEKAYLALLVAHSQEIKFGLAGSETSVVSYQLGRFEMRLLENGHSLLRVLQSEEIPLPMKQTILTNLREAALRGDITSASHK